MKPALFDYVAPQSIEGALEALASDEMARPLAGGQSLIPTMNFRIAAPSTLVDLARINALKGYAVDGDVIRVGAMTRQRDLERDAAVQPKSSSWVRAGLRKTLVDWGDERIERGPRGSPCG